MHVVRDDLWFCGECRIIAVNGDYSCLQYYLDGDAPDERIAEIDAGLASFGPHLVNDEGEEEGDGYEEFSCYPCDCCGCAPGDRYRFAVLGA